MPGAAKLAVTFDKQCRTVARQDVLRFYKQEPSKQRRVRREDAFFEFSGSKVPEMQIIDGDHFWVGFMSESNQKDWGFKFTVRDVRDPNAAADIAIAEFNKEFDAVCQAGKGDDSITFERFCTLARPKEDPKVIFTAVAQGDIEVVRDYLERSKEDHKVYNYLA